MDINYYTKWLSFIFFCAAVIIHIGFFVYESFILQKQQAQTTLRISSETHHFAKPWLFNQGLYNLFLAVQMSVGLYYVRQLRPDLAGPLVGFPGIAMMIAGVVLFFSAPRLRKWALLQALPPALGFFFLMFHIFNR